MLAWTVSRLVLGDIRFLDVLHNLSRVSLEDLAILFSEF